MEKRIYSSQWIESWVSNSMDKYNDDGNTIIEKSAMKKYRENGLIIIMQDNGEIFDVTIRKLTIRQLIDKVKANMRIVGLKEKHIEWEVLTHLYDEWTDEEGITAYAFNKGIYQGKVFNDYREDNILLHGSIPYNVLNNEGKQYIKEHFDEEYWVTSNGYLVIQGFIA